MKTINTKSFFLLILCVITYSSSFSQRRYKDENPIFYFDLYYIKPQFKGGSLNGGGFRIGLASDLNRKLFWQGGLGFDYSANSRFNSQDSLPDFSAIKSFEVPFLYFEPTININNKLYISFPIKSSFSFNNRSEYDNRDFARLNDLEISVFSFGLGMCLPLNETIMLGVQTDYRFVYDYQNPQHSVRQKEFNGINTLVYLRFAW